MITIGILAAFLSDTLFAYIEAWRWMLGIVALPGATFLIGVVLLPESPRWLMMRGRTAEAKTVLDTLRGDPAIVKDEMTEIAEQLKRPQRGWTMFLRNANFRRSVGLGVVLQTMQQFTGMNVVMYYAPSIFAVVGFKGQDALWGTAIVGLVNVLSTFIAIAMVDKLGRRPILIGGFAVMAVGLGALGVALHIGTNDLPIQIFAVAMLLMFIVGFAVSAGPVIWVLCSEVQPIEGRDFGIAVSTFTNWTANFFVGLTFLSMLTGLGSGATFGIYAALNAAFLAITFFFVPETNGVSLEAIEANLMAGRPLRHLGD
jgi:SP family galactose:H+ symporter-like MFS transporter